MMMPNWESSSIGALAVAIFWVIVEWIRRGRREEQARRQWEQDAANKSKTRMP